MIKSHTFVENLKGHDAEVIDHVALILGNIVILWVIVGRYSFCHLLFLASYW